MANFFNENLMECKKCKQNVFEEIDTFSLKEIEHSNLITKDKTFKKVYESKKIKCISCGAIIDL